MGRLERVVTDLYDAELGAITDQDREYAQDLIDDYEEDKEHGLGVSTVAQWLRKVRYEAVMADRKKRNEVEEGHTWKKHS